MHLFKQDITDISLPKKFTYPFYYTPHPLCILAANSLKEYISSRYDWKEEINKGKMFGVLVVTDKMNKIGYLAAFSGVLAGSNIHSFFVPPVYDLLSPKSFFREEEEKINTLNGEIESLENDYTLLQLHSELKEKKEKYYKVIATEKEKIKNSKAARDHKRSFSSISNKENEDMIKESQHEKAQFKRLERSIKNELLALTTKIELIEQDIERIKRERKEKAAILQNRLFKEFKFLNAKGETKDLCDIFSTTVNKTPPAGAGECAAPRLLQYAYINNLHPIAMAEFWWGESPKKEIRRNGLFYPACKGKCKPILSHMLQGLDVEDNPLNTDTNKCNNLETLYEDDYIMIVNKPAGMLTVPGKGNKESVESIVREAYPFLTGPVIVHRLDMATSGLIIITKDKNVHKTMQEEFRKRNIKKRYIAIVQGNIKEEKGFIRLSLIADHYDRPRQIVDEVSGKPAITRYEVITHLQKDGKEYTRIALYPLTGRTHQLRVHCASPLGLDAPILGDELYGEKSTRLYLHAERLEFRHPITNKIITIEKKAEF